MLIFLLCSLGRLGAAEPIRALLVAGGCCHDYGAQQKIISEGISARANVTWTIRFDPQTGKDHAASVYTNADWAKGFDVVVHDDCYGDVTNTTFVERIAKPHQDGVPAVVLHCAIHSYRNSPSDEWRKVLGVSSFRHQPRRDFEVVTVNPNHPVMKGFPTRWMDASDELYEIVKVWPGCVPLAKGVTPGKDDDLHPSIWVHTNGKVRTFGTTLGHGNETVSKPEYLELITRGLLWACDKLDEKGEPKPGYGKK
jgi:type 1 glutamine amidotransferase